MTITKGSATYSPEDNKLRLYVGRVSREEFEKLRADGWQTLHKQREAGGGDFAAVWTPRRRDTAIAYSESGTIDDEDMSPAERAADRAERFAGYREKRTDEATGHADRYDAGPQAHGYQSEARAARAADRHDRIADRAGDAWSRAEYWQRRTAGVIAHALHKAAPGVRMGRIKKIESEIRAIDATRNEQIKRWNTWKKIAAISEPEQQNKAAKVFAGMATGSQEYQHPRQEAKKGSLWELMEPGRTDNDPITGAEAAALYFADRLDPASDAWNDTHAGQWRRHLELRIAYEWQMIDAQGGRAATEEIQIGGTWDGATIAKVNKSNATGRAVSVAVIVPKVTGWHYQVTNEPGTPFALMLCKTERAAPGTYQPPTDDSRAKLAEFEAARKAAAVKRKAVTPPCPLINPTDEDAERLQAVWNSTPGPYGRRWANEPIPTVMRMTQAQYSARAGGSFTHCETEEITGGGARHRHGLGMRNERFPSVAKVRRYADRVIIITDKPQKPFPAEVWNDPRPGVIAELAAALPELEAAARLSWLPEGKDPESTRARHLLEQAALVGLCFISSLTQFGFTDAGNAWRNQIKEAAPVA